MSRKGVIISVYVESSSTIDLQYKFDQLKRSQANEFDESRPKGTTRRRGYDRRAQLLAYAHELRHAKSTNPQYLQYKFDQLKRSQANEFDESRPKGTTRRRGYDRRAQLLAYAHELRHAKSTNPQCTPNPKHKMITRDTVSLRLSIKSSVIAEDLVYLDFISAGDFKNLALTSGDGISEIYSNILVEILRPFSKFLPQFNTIGDDLGLRESTVFTGLHLLFG
ncbi:hypothetical protein BC332_24191 [Capsicum chinense]|nr:hypothetical protein BC332_24191 [Capsicum chinense]